MEPHRLFFLRKFYIFALRSPSSIAKMAKNGPCNVQIQIQCEDTVVHAVSCMGVGAALMYSASSVLFLHHFFSFWFFFPELIRRYQIQYGGKGDILHCCHCWGYWSFAAGHSAAHEFCWNRVLRGEFIYLSSILS